MKNNPVPQFRHELKYIISYLEKDVIVRRLQTILQSDEHATNGSYFIRSLYFDDWWESAYKEKQIGCASRKKYRIRTYNYSDTVIRLERKRKEGSYILKESAQLTREEAEQLMKEDYRFLLKRNEQVCRDFYVECVSNLMRPKVIVDYEREPFVYPYGDVRITFDTGVRAGMMEFDIFDKSLPTAEVLEPEKLIMEVKFTEYLPNIIREILPPENSEYTAASKYVMCLDKRKEFHK